MNIDEVGVNTPVIVPTVRGNGPSIWNVIVIWEGVSGLGRVWDRGLDEREIR